MDEVKVFTEQHTPERSRYVKKIMKDPDMFGNKWRWVRASLTDEVIGQALFGIMAVAYFQQQDTTVLGLDIDDHQKKGEAYTLSRYDAAINRLGGQPPSLLIQSPRGYHAYWYLTQRLKTDVVITAAKERLQGIDVEIRPTTTQALRLPNVTRIVTTEPPFTTHTESFKYLIDNAPRYTYKQLFHDLFTQKKQTPQQRKKRLTNFTTTSKLEKAEVQIAPGGFEPGRSNDQLVKLVTQYRIHGLTVEDALDRVLVLLDRSYLYNGDLTTQRLEQRIRSFYKKKIQPKIRASTLDLFDNPLIDDIVALSPFAKQREKPLRRFLSKILSCVNYHNSLSQEERQHWIYTYNYYTAFRRQGYYPFPYSLLREWNHRYFELLPFLVSIGFLIPSPFNYSTDSNYCKHYAVNRNCMAEGEGGEESSKSML